jgi:hypothetical protein
MLAELDQSLTVVVAVLVLLVAITLAVHLVTVALDGQQRLLDRLLLTLVAVAVAAGLAVLTRQVQA